MVPFSLAYIHIYIMMILFSLLTVPSLLWVSVQTHTLAHAAMNDDEENV